MQLSRILTTACFCALIALDADSSVEIEVNNSPETNDDYFCWSPVNARVKLQNQQPDPMEVLVSADSSGNSNLEFSLSVTGQITAQNYTPLQEIELTG